MPLNIALDGPVGAGKSSIADRVARRLSILHLDTGAMYRALGLYAMRITDVQSEEKVVAAIENADVAVTYENGEQRTFLCGEDVTGLIRSPEVSMAASTVSRYRKVREKMVAIQQQMAEKTAMIVDGRDIGTKVLPNAPVKIFLTAQAKERARRRYNEMIEKGMPADYNTVLTELKQRDAQDENRAVDPLRPAADAYILDSTYMSIDQVVDTIIGRVEASK